MRKTAVITMVVAIFALVFVSGARHKAIQAHSKSPARITPTGAAPEPYVNSRLHPHEKLLGHRKGSRRERSHPPRDQFIEGLKVSPELRTWLKGHEVLDLIPTGTWTADHHRRRS